MDITSMEQQELRVFAGAIETFNESVKQKCQALQTDISTYSAVMRDDVSKDALRRADEICTAILELLNPSQQLLDKIYRIVNTLNDAPRMRI